MPHQCHVRSKCAFSLRPDKERGVSQAKQHEGLYNKLLYDPYWSILALRKSQSADRCAIPNKGKINHAIPEFFMYEKDHQGQTLTMHTHPSSAKFNPVCFQTHLLSTPPFPWVLGLERDLLNLWGIRRMHKKELGDNSNKMHSRTVKDYLSNIDTICSYKRKIMTGCKMWGTSRTEPNPPSSLDIEGCSISLLGWGCKQL